jgi:hypothetical protein
MSFTTTERWWWGSRTHSDTGVSLEDVVNAAAPTLPAAENAILRVTVTVSGEWGRAVTLALGELDPNFGNHPAYLALTQDGWKLPAPELVVPGTPATRGAWRTWTGSPSACRARRRSPRPPPAR